MKKTTDVTKQGDKTVFPKMAAESNWDKGTCVCERTRRRKAAESVRKLARWRSCRALLTLRAEDEIIRRMTETGHDCFCHVVPFFYL